MLRHCTTNDDLALKEQLNERVRPPTLARRVASLLKQPGWRCRFRRRWWSAQALCEQLAGGNFAIACAEPTGGLSRCYPGGVRDR